MQSFSLFILSLLYFTGNEEMQNFLDRNKINFTLRTVRVKICNEKEKHKRGEINFSGQDQLDCLFNTIAFNSDQAIQPPSHYKSSMDQLKTTNQPFIWPWSLTSDSNSNAVIR